MSNIKKTNKLVRWIKNPRLPLLRILINCSKIIKSDRLYLKIYFRLAMREKLDLNNPQTYNQKIQWLKLNNTHDLYTKMADKYEAREIVKNIIGEKHLIPLLGVWDRFDDINFDNLPNQFVLKANHDCGTVIICRDKTKLDIRKTKIRFEKALCKNYFYNGREYPYKNIKPRIIAEKLMVDESGVGLKDYKFFCFNGVPKFLFIATDRNIGQTKFDFFDIDFNHLQLTNGYENSLNQQIKPKNYEVMVDLAAKLSKGILHIRVDFYNINGIIYFGEFTFHHWGGIVPFKPKVWDKVFGDFIELPLKTN